MQVKNISAQELLNRLRMYFQESDFTRKYANEKPPLRAELFNTAQLDQHGKYLAGIHEVKTGITRDRLLKRLAKNEKILTEVRTLLLESVKEERVISPAGEWILDNFYLIEDHINTGKRHLPRGYSEGLPRLKIQSTEDIPRVYDLALELVSHSDGRIDLESLRAFVTAYQSVTSLKLGELWAIPIMLRLALIENLRRVSARVAIDRVNRNLAEYWSGLMKDTAEKDPKSLILVIADMARLGPPMESSFVAEMVRQLMWLGPGLALPLSWMEQRLSENGLTCNEMVNIENQKQAADQVSISNSIGSLRFLGSVEWHKFVEDISAVEQTLRTDTSGIYPTMDFATRDHYRHVVEKIAKHSKLQELKVASIAVGLTLSASTAPADDLARHVGYYLTGDGRPALEKATGTKYPFREQLGRWLRRHPTLTYAGNIVLLTLLITWFVMSRLQDSVVSQWIIAATIVCSVIGISQLATAVVNWLVTLFKGPEMLPRLDFTEGIPAEHTTLVTVPTMLSSIASADALLESLEVRFLANKDRNLYFGLLTDFTDAQTEVKDGDEQLLAHAAAGIAYLNTRYADGGYRFFLFHRPRKWNAQDKVWMGYERKRGKLAELNNLLRGRGAENFSKIVGDVAALRAVKYVITLDTDTQLPRDAGWKLTGTMAHVMNRPWYDEARKRITRGYSILQPRVSVSLTRDQNSIYSHLHGNEPGIDPYTRLTSDVYQDLFGEGSFIGKGIYDVDAFSMALEDTFPENRILSHDLLEGCYARAGLASDIQFYEEYPLSYAADVNRRHRWIRGDWQIGYWVLPYAPGPGNKLRKNPLSLLAKWKIADNLRRSLVAVSLVCMLLLGWTVLNDPAFWTVVVVGIVMLPSVISTGWGILHKHKEITFSQHFSLSIQAFRDGMIQNVFMFACLPYEAYYSLDAIVRTCWRMLITHKHLLEWVPSRSQEHTSDKSIPSAYRAMWISPALAVITFAGLLIFMPVSMVIALPVLLLWAAAPVISWWISKPLTSTATALTDSQVAYLRRTARKTWAFFETFVAAADNYLPPDNYQERPGNMIAHRTSPTNIGLGLLANLTAYDFGYLPASELLLRSGQTIASMLKLERYKGHLYNWYDTVTLQPLSPRYISTVDSGNMAGHLLTFRQGLLTIANEPLISKQLFEGLSDTLAIIEKEKAGIPAIAELRAYMDTILAMTIMTRENFVAAISQIVALAATACAQLIAEQPVTEKSSEANWWAQNMLKQCRNMQAYAADCYGWVATGDIPERFRELYAAHNANTLTELSKLYNGAASQLKAPQGLTEAEAVWLNGYTAALSHASAYAAAQLHTAAELADSCNILADMEYEFLYDKSKHLLSIGYNVDDHRLDPGCYDLLASEASLCSFVAIAQGKIPQESWFSLGRLLTNSGGKPVLLSWSGSMFEYLMPQLVMPVYESTLIHQTNLGAVRRQIAYGEEQNVPWGISESGYNMVDANLNYQYHAFGVPGLGLKRGLSESLVTAPYASAMALMILPDEACRNMELLSRQGFEGRYGLYEAIDYTASRLPRGQSYALIQSFMSHHQGMAFLSMAYAVLGQPLQKRFEAELQFQATMLLLQERVPKATTYYPQGADTTAAVQVAPEADIEVITTPHTPIPEVQLLSNGRYHVMVSNSGGGYSRWKGLSVTRWREDTTCDNWGTFCYIRDLEDGTFWSNTYQPTMAEPKSYEAIFSQGRAEFRRRDDNIETHTEMVVSPEDDIEMRRIHVTNHSRRPRTIELTSYCEVVITPANADSAHPAFSNLFIQTELAVDRCAILSTRRPRAADERPPYMFHMMTHHGGSSGQTSFETDRRKFIGRGRTTANPQSLDTREPLSNSSGAVLDPIAAIRNIIVLQPDETVVVDIITGISPDKDGCMGLIEKYQDKHHKDRVFELAWTHSQVLLRQINASEADAQRYSKLAGSIIYNNPMLRADAAIIQKNHRGQSGLWGYSVSGDLPIVLLEIESDSSIELVKQLVQAHAYWRLKGLATDLVIFNEDHGGYRQDLQNQIMGLVATSAGMELTDQPGAIFVKAADQITNEDRVLFQAVARINISDTKGSLIEFINRKNTARNIISLLPPSDDKTYQADQLPVPEGLQFFNGTGGFTPDGKEYCIIIKDGKLPPAPWVNVLSNPDFGTIVSEAGQAYTWAENAHEFRLTPWENDAVTDKGGEVFYMRDEEKGSIWSPSPLPATGQSLYIVNHGFGYSRFQTLQDGIYTEMQVFVDIEDPIKFVMLKTENRSGRQRKLSATGYAELVLGDLRPKNAMHIVTETDPVSGVLFARNAYNKEFDGRIVFFDTDDITSFTADRADFIGRNGSLRNADGMLRTRLSGRTGAALDPCMALQTAFTLAPGQERIIVFRLGAGQNIDLARKTAQKHKGIEAAYSAIQRSADYWQRTLGSIQINTPNAALNVLTNGWVLYQTIACRLWARSGYYQSGGAFGFRDQLQDTLSVMHAQPSLTRTQILLCASRQFREGDVQHWWHPPVGRGVRTRCSDDMLWLPYATAAYVLKTGDKEILNEKIQFIESRMLNKGEDSHYDLPVESGEYATLYDHCRYAIQHSLKFGKNGIPLMGSGDWNDGMDLVGTEGHGESIWLGFFLYDVLMKFTAMAKLQGDEAFNDVCVAQAKTLQANIDKNGWDGDWYRRAYFDDGTPLGSKSNTECIIDSISQSWSVISGGGAPDKAAKGLAAADKMLVKPDKMLIQLLDPPFDKAEPNPGYIRGYVPGIRENGGQYTHAAVWMIMAHAKQGNVERAWELLDMVNPVNHGSNAELIAMYKTEPYVVAADVYSVPPNSGSGGWTWYTGSAGWMYQLITDWLLGIRKEGEKLSFTPQLPEKWESCKITYRYLTTVYQITIYPNAARNGIIEITLDGAAQPGNALSLADTGREHTVAVRLPGKTRANNDSTANGGPLAEGVK